MLPVDLLDYLVAPKLPKSQENKFNHFKKFITLNLMNQDSERYILNPSSAIDGGSDLHEFKDDIMDVTLRLMKEGKVVMNKSTDVPRYRDALESAKHRRSDKPYLLMFDIVSDISRDIHQLEQMLYKRMIDKYFKFRSPRHPHSQDELGEPWELNE